MKEIYLAGGCFWGVEGFFAQINGVIKTTVGYANGKTEGTSYYELSKTGHAETVHIVYDPQLLRLKELLGYYFLIIDPVSLNKQGHDHGAQYRTGIYYTDETDQAVINALIAKEQKKVKQKIAVEVQPLHHYILAEAYHQQYLEKNPGGYCHVDFSLLPKEARRK